MKNWQIVFTADKKTFSEDVVQGATYTTALLNAMLKHPDTEIVELVEV